MTPAYFEAEFSLSNPLFHTCLYRGADRFDFTQEPNGSYHTLPNVSFFMSERTGVENAAADSSIGIRYSKDSGITSMANTKSAAYIQQPAHLSASIVAAT